MYRYRCYKLNQPWYSASPLTKEASKPILYTHTHTHSHTHMWLFRRAKENIFTNKHFIGLKIDAGKAVK